jgi:hypothetical protein
LAYSQIEADELCSEILSFANHFSRICVTDVAVFRKTLAWGFFGQVEVMECFKIQRFAPNYPATQLA